MAIIFVPYNNNNAVESYQSQLWLCQVHSMQPFFSN